MPGAAGDDRRDALDGWGERQQGHAAALNAEAEAQFRANAPAWAFFQSQSPSYQRTATWWVISAKQAATRHKRLATLIEDSAQGRTIKALTRPGKATE